MKAQLPALASSLSHSFQSSLALSVSSPECLFEWPSGPADTCAGIDFLFYLKSCFKCVATKHRIDMSRLLLKFEMMMLRKTDKRTTVKQIKQSEEQLDERGERISNIWYFHHPLLALVTRLKVTLTGYQDPGGRRSIVIKIRAELDHNIWSTMTRTRSNNA